jgi:hypothetical protein
LASGPPTSFLVPLLGTAVLD